MNKILSYQISAQIYNSNRTIVYRGFEQLKQQPVILKLPHHPYPNFKELTQYRNAYAIVKNLNLSEVVKMLAIEQVEQRLMLVMADIGGISLCQDLNLLNLSTDISKFFHIALQIANTLDKLHQHRIIHKDIKPQNIIINPQTQQIQLIDFSSATQLPKETPEIRNPNALEGTLAYMSPEQTGRMNRGIDYRSDFYSLGVTFYELLTGKLPFNSTDPLELIHCHIARQPVAPVELNSNISELLNAIVLKLMAKTPEARYQTAAGLRHDLEKCQSQWETTEKTETTALFDLGGKDRSNRLIIPEKLYGRNREVETMLAAFDRIAKSSQSTIELMLVAGFSGIGKSALVNEIHKPIVEKRGYFISGKFDQFQRDIPLSAWLSAFQELIRQILSEPEVKLQAIATKLQQVLGAEGQVLIDVIPELELLIGKQPPATELSPTAAENRFNLLLPKFISVFAQAEHPLVIFLDDLQWADLTSLKLIKLVMEKTDIKYLLLIGAYRDNEVSASHALRLTVEEIKKIGVVVNQITLTPLSQSALNNLVADTLNYSSQESLPLTKQVYRKTQGNPFFSTQFLNSLHREGLIFFNSQQSKWLLNLPEIKVLAASGDVVQLMASQIQKLPQSTQELLQLAACISNQFDLATLSIVSEKSLSETALSLWNALSAGLILPEDETYKFYQGESHDTLLETTDLVIPIYHFLHDRVQQAAYSLIPEDKKQETHLKIGKLLLNNTGEEKLEEKIFEIVNQLNYGIELIGEPEKREELASLNLKAGIKAKVSTAYTVAIAYFNTGINLLTQNSWETQYELTLALHEEAAEAAYLSGEFEQMERMISLVLETANKLLDKIKVYEIKIQAEIALGQPFSALNTALSVLEMLDIRFPKNPTQTDIEECLKSTKTALAGRNISEIINLPILQEPYKLAGLRILSTLVSLSMIAKPNLFTLVVCEPIILSLQAGISPLFAFSCAMYGIILCANQDIVTGYQFGRLAAELLEKFNYKENKAKILEVLYVGIEHWKKPLQEILPHFIEVYQLGLETGDLEYANYSIIQYCASSYFVGKTLDELEKEITNYSYSLKQLKQKNAYYYNEICHQAVLNLIGKSEKSKSLSGSAYNEVEFISFYQDLNDSYGLFKTYLHKLFITYLFGNFQCSKHYAVLAGECVGSVSGLFYFPIYYFYSSLAQLACYSQAEVANQEQILAEVAAKQEKIRYWAEHAPMNYTHKYYLIEAQRQQVVGEKIAAIEAYEQAIALATQNKYIQEAALANELCAKFYLEWGKNKIAQTYMIEAYYGYLNWGAIAKLRDLEQRYRELLAPILISSPSNIDPLNPSSTYSSISQTNSQNLLDINTVIKASQTLSQEIKLENLLSRLMQLVIENAGAQNCALILLKNEQLVLEAIAHTPEMKITDNQKHLRNFERPMIPVAASLELPQTLINYVWRTQKFLVFDDATSEAKWANDPYIKQQQPKSILCTPIVKQGKFIGILYLENNLTNSAFTPERLQLLEMITAQAAISLENALLYDTLEQKVEQRTQELNQKNQYLAQTLEELKRTQTQLIQTEKMSSLGQLVAGIAHEINNPVNFIYGNLTYTQEYAQELLEVIKTYQHHYPQPVDEVEKIIEKVELEFLVADLPKLINSMKVGANRIRKIVESLRNFSRLDEAEVKNADLHEGIDSTLMILQNSLKAKPHEREITVVKNYSKLPKIKCYPGELNQVFMNIISNGIDALEALRTEQNDCPPQITITTQIDATNQVIISIVDNGMGMSEEVQKRIFDPFYTTKPVGKGTGLGLAISYQIVVKRHGGQLECISTPSKGTEFIIKIPLR